MSTYDLIRSDLRRYMATGAGSRVRVILFAQGFWATTVYRISHGIFQWRIPVPPVRSAVRFACQVARKLTEIVTGISLSPECDIGPGLYIGHFGPVIVSPATRIGANCNLAQGVTLGYGGRGDRAGHPVLGDRVYIAANAVVVGPIEIGHDAVVGAGAVVTKSVPPRGVVVGNPSHLASRRGSFDFIRYDGMHDDPARQASWREAENAALPGADEPPEV
jgi:serine O-acetyltransferase